MIRQVLSQYQNAPLSFYAYSISRLVVCPFPRLLHYVPSQGSLIDLGCGMGLWLNYLALQYPSLTLQGIDADPRKIEGAARSRQHSIGYQKLDALALSSHQYDCVTVLDVLYLLDPPTKQQWIDQAAHALKPGGTLLIKEVDIEPRWKYQWNLFEETLAVKVVGMTHGNALYIEPSTHYAERMTQAGFQGVRIDRIDRGYIHPHVAIVGKLP